MRTRLVAALASALIGLLVFAFLAGNFGNTNWGEAFSIGVVFAALMSFFLILTSALLIRMNLFLVALLSGLIGTVGFFGFLALKGGGCYGGTCIGGEITLMISLVFSGSPAVVQGAAFHYFQRKLVQ